MWLNVTIRDQRLRRLAALFFAFGVSVCYSGSTAFAADTVNFKIHFAITPAYTFLFVAKEKGYYADANIDVKFFSGTGSLAALTELSQAKWDFSTGDFGDVIQLVSKGANVKAVYFTYQQTPVGYAVWKESDIVSPKDFVGKKYGSQKFNLATVALPVVCKIHNVNCDKIEFVHVDFNVQVQAFINGDFQILGGFLNTQGIILENLGKQIRWIPAADVYQEVIATTDKLLQSRPDLVKRFVTATAKGAKYTVENPDEAANILLKHHAQLGGTPEAKKLVLAQVKSWGSLVRSDDTDRHGYGYGSPEKTTATLNLYSQVRGITGISSRSVYSLP